MIADPSSDKFSGQGVGNKPWNDYDYEEETEEENKCETCKYNLRGKPNIKPNPCWGCLCYDNYESEEEDDV